MPSSRPVRRRIARMLAPSVAALALAVAVPSAALAASPVTAWQAATVPAGITSIASISCGLSATECAAVGNATTAQGFQESAALTTTTGAAWSSATLAGAPSAGFQGADYSGVDCSGLSCVAVGTVGYSQNAVATSANGGATWALAPSVPQPSPVQDNLAAVSCASYPNCVAVGSDLGTTGAVGQFQILTSTTGGATWTPVAATLPQPQADNILTGVSCVGTGCVAVGYAQSQQGQVSNAILVSADGGQTWSAAASVPQPSASSQWLSGVSCVTATQCVAVGYQTDSAGFNLNQVLVSNDGGANWTLASVPNPGLATNGDTLNAVACDTAECVAVGQYASANWVAQNQVLVSTDGGTNWTQQAAPNPGGAYTSQQLTAVACGATSCVAGGEVEGWNGAQAEALYGAA